MAEQTYISATVGIVDDHPLVIDALRSRLGEAGFEIAGSWKYAEDVGRADGIDVIVCDLNFEGGELQAGFAVANLVERGHRVLAISGVAVRAEVLDAIANGASGFVEKTSSASEFVHAVREVAAGGLFASARLADYLLDDANRKPLSRGEITRADRRLLAGLAGGDRIDELAEDEGTSIIELRAGLERVFDAAKRRRRLHRPSPREAELLVLLGCEGLSHKAAAQRMGIKTIVIPDFQKDIKAKYLASHPDAKEDIAPKTVAQLWARELGLC